LERRWLVLSKELMTLTLPIMGTQLSQTGMGVVDTIVAGKASAADLAAIAVGASIWLPLLLFVSGVMVAVSPRVANAFGANNPARMQETLQQGLWLALLIGLLSLIIMPLFTPPLLNLMSVDPELHASINRYVTYVAFGLPAAAMFQTLRSYNEAMGLTMPVMLISFAGLFLNIPLNLLFVFGAGPIDPMGGPGCGLATALIFMLMLSALAAYTHFAAPHRAIKPLNNLRKPNRAAMDILRLGFPIGLAIFVEVSLFCVVALFIASLGTVVIASHQIALNVSSVTFMIPLSLALALTVQVGQNLGRNDPTMARAAWLNGLRLNLSLALFNALLLAIGGALIASWYSNNPEIVSLAASLMLYAAVYQFSDSAQVAAAGALRGYEDTTITFLLTLVAFWGIGLPSGYWLGMGMPEPMGAAGFWIGLVIGLTANALLLGLRLRFISRRAMQKHQM
jgi:multidrug resistance protein, MATE family